MEEKKIKNIRKKITAASDTKIEQKKKYYAHQNFSFAV